MKHVAAAQKVPMAGPSPSSCSFRSSPSRNRAGRRTRSVTRAHQQRGGFGLGLIVGLVIGLALALGVALYITKAPVPFVNKVPQRSADQDAVEAQRNKNWDPNAPLASKVPRPAPPAAEEPASDAAAAAPVKGPASAAADATGSVAAPARNPAALLAGQSPAAAPAPAAPAPGAAKTTKGAELYTYFVQAGAFQRPDDAEAQRARLTMMGLEPRVLEREQAGRTVYRVRLGPFDKQADAETLREKLAATGMEAALVRMERPPQ
jgi:cell division protein FtsN